jgi:hypothetical protein
MVSTRGQSKPTFGGRNRRLGAVTQPSRATGGGGGACDRSDTDWAFTAPDTRATVVLTTDLGAVVQKIGRLRWVLWAGRGPG